MDMTRERFLEICKAQVGAAVENLNRNAVADKAAADREEAKKTAAVSKK